MAGEAITNGASRTNVLALAALPSDDPMSKVLGLDAKTSGFAAWFGFTSAGTLLVTWFMGLAIAAAWWRSVHTTYLPSQSEEIEILREEAPPPPPPVAAPAEPEAPPPKAAPHIAPREAPPPAPAQAAKVLTQEPRPDEPIDLTGNTFVQGNSDVYAGGFTTSNGTSTTAVRTQASPTGVPGGTGAPTAPAGPPKVDRSRRASLGGSSDWNCPFPPEADSAQMDEAYVTLQVDVRADGSPATVRVTSDPGNGFGREARRCALGKRFSPELDADGNAVAGTTKPFRVHFSR
jgi:protein TonB